MTNLNFSVLFLPDCGPDVGMGHLLRSLSLATAVGQLGPRSLVATPRWAGVEALVEAAGGTLVDENIDELVAHQLGVRAVVVDSYRAGANNLRAWREAGFILVAIDDLAAFPSPAHVIVNPAIGANRRAYSSRSDAKYLLGPSYALLRPQFWSNPKRVTRPVVHDILVLSGGADLADIGPRIVRALEAIPGPLDLKVVQGPLSRNCEDLWRAARASTHETCILVDPPAIDQLMRRADLAVSAAGQTLYELAAVGTPAVAVQIADNQADHLRGLAKAGVVVPVGHVDDPQTMARLVAAVRQASNDPAQRAQLAGAGRALVDGGGAQRVAQHVLEACAGA